MLRKSILLSLLIYVFSVLIFAQIPDKFTNLQVLPKLITKDELVQTMRSFTDALGVNCGFCHAQQEGSDKLDFPADKKTEKEEARVMLKMVMGINNDYLTKLSQFTKDVISVKCITCHRGNQRPVMLEDTLLSTIKEKGLTEAVSTYHKLRDQYYGSFTYDFASRTLLKLVETLNDENRFDDAIGIGNLNIEMSPQSALAFYSLGEAYQAKGDKDKALENYEKAKTLMQGGNTGFIDRKIQELKE